MKIDESTINHNAIRLIKENTDYLYELIEKDSHECHTAEVSLAEITGIVRMAEAMKKCLKI